MNGEVLRNLLKEDKPLISPGCFDALSALLIEKAGFSCASVSGAAVTAAQLGLPDRSFIGLEEMARLVAQISSVVKIPLLVDCESGYGNAITAMRAMRLMQKMGAACVCFQDKRSINGELMPAQEMVGLLRAAVQGRGTGDTLLMARTDSLKKYGIDEAIARCRQYIAAGADILFINGVSTEAEMAAIAGENLGVPLKFNNTIKEASAQFSAQELYKRGFQLIAFSATLQKAAIKAMQTVLETLKATGGTQDCIPMKITQQQREKLLNGAQWDAWAQEYMG